MNASPDIFTPCGNCENQKPESEFYPGMSILCRIRAGADIRVWTANCPAARRGAFYNLNNLYDGEDCKMPGNAAGG